MTTTLKRLRPYLVVLVAFSFFSSCNEKSDFDNYINHTKPFGLNWTLSADQIVEIETKILEGCETYDLASESTTQLIKSINKKNCLGKKFHRTFSLKPQADFGSEDESISVITKNGVSPVIYEYSFLHSLQDDAESTKKRKYQSTKFKKALKKKYGAPIATGHFDQEALTGFVKTDSETPECSFWEIKDAGTGILLCEQRVIYLDGFEMSLSYIQLNGVPFGKAFQKMLSGKETVPVMDYENGYMTFPDIHNYDYLLSDSFLRHLEGWKSVNVVKNCNKDGIEKLKTKINISEELSALITDEVLNQHEDRLAEYAIRIINEDVFDISDNEREKLAIMLLLRAANRGSATAMNEIGVSLLYCHQNVEQNLSEGINWIQKASAKNDPNANYTLARLIMAKEVQSGTPMSDVKILLGKCAEKGLERCQNALKDIAIYEKYLAKN